MGAPSEKAPPAKKEEGKAVEGELEKEAKKLKDAKEAKKNGKDAKPEVEMSEEDAALKENLELMVTRAGDPAAGVAKLALETMRKEIKTATRCVREHSCAQPWIWDLARVCARVCPC